MTRKNVLIVCAYLRCDRAQGQFREFLQPMSALHIAALIDRDRYHVRLHLETYHGPFDVRTAGEYDLVFLTGLQKDFDRMRQLSFFFRKAGVPTVAGGNLCTLFPEFAGRFFDAVCAGSVDATAAVMRDFEEGALRKIYRHPPERVSPYQLDHRLLEQSGIRPPVHFIEASRGCNFKCDFCVLPAEGARHAPFAVATVMASIRDSIAAAPRFSLRRLYPTIWFLDNNFSNDPRHLRQMCAALKAEPQVKRWGAMVTQDVLRNRELISLMADSKCFVIFTGIESLDVEFLAAHSKRQNIAGGPGILDDVEFAATRGIHVIYGYLFDPRLTSIEKFKTELEALVESDVLMYPNYISLMMPLAGTKLFRDGASRGELLPRLRLRDLDGESVAYRATRDDLQALSRFAQVLYRTPKPLVSGARLWRKLIRYLLRFRVVNPIVWYVLYRNTFRSILQARGYSRGMRNYIGGQDVLDPEYRQIPTGTSEADRRTYFDPVLITDDDGASAPWMEEGGQGVSLAARNARSASSPAQPA